MNRKSAAYDKSYVALFNELKAVYIEKDDSRILPLFESLKKFQNSIAIKWKKLLFDTSLTTVVKKDPVSHLQPLPKGVLDSEEKFKEFFFLTMHVNKAKATLEDYQDLNRRYLGLTNCFIFEDNIVKLDVVPKQFFRQAEEELYRQAYTKCEMLEQRTSLQTICPALVFNEAKVIKGLNEELGTNVETIKDVYNEVDKIRYKRLKKLVDSKFTNDKLVTLLNDFDNRNDEEINQMVTDNADIPTIFEYVLGIIWWKVSGEKGKVLDFLKLSLDANLLPITHAAGGEADIVYEYQECIAYPKHSLLLEATLADGTNQRRMEMEPVSRHLGNHLLRTGNDKSYCVFATTFLHVNVIGDFRMRKNIMYCDSQNADNYVQGMKIIPLCTNDLRYIIQEKITYDRLYKHFETAYISNEQHPQKWYDGYVNIEKTYPNYYKHEDHMNMAAEPDIHKD